MVKPGVAREKGGEDSAKPFSSYLAVLRWWLARRLKGLLVGASRVRN